jgi:hypothetical protein
MAAAQAPLLVGRGGLAGAAAKVRDHTSAILSVCAFFVQKLHPVRFTLLGIFWNVQCAHSIPRFPLCCCPVQGVAQQHAQRLSVAYNNLAGILKLTARLQECIQCYEHVVYLQVTRQAARLCRGGPDLQLS